MCRSANLTLLLTIRDGIHDRTAACRSLARLMRPRPSGSAR